MDQSENDRARSLLRRTPLLAACADEPLTRTQLTERTDASRTTVYRATNDLEAEGLLEKTGSGYRTTAQGGALLAAGEHYEAAVGTIDRLDALFDLVEHEDLLEHAHHFADATVVVADAADPYRVVDHVLERFAETTTSRGTIASTTAVEAVERAMPALSGDQRIERVFAASALETHETIGGEAFREATAADGLSLLVADDAAVPFSFAIDDRDVSVVGHDPTTGLPTVHVETDSPAARAWLEAVYERCREQASSI